MKEYELLKKAFRSLRNTKVVQQARCVDVVLCGNVILKVYKNHIKLDSCQHRTQTTKRRINQVLDLTGYSARVFQKDFDWKIVFKNSVINFDSSLTIYK